MLRFHFDAGGCGQVIESRLKVVLPEDVGAALQDGVVLCHLANHVRPRSVASIHVPSPAVPKLTIARQRRNIDNFVDACRRLGVPEVRPSFVSVLKLARRHLLVLLLACRVGFSAILEPSASP